MRFGARKWLPFAVAVCAAAAAVAASKPLPTFERVMNIEPRAVVDLELTDHTGKRRRLSDFAGAPAFVFFGFTHCPDACPTTLQKLAMINAAEGAPLKGLRVVLISVDGERDTPEQVRNLALSFSAPFFKDAPKDGAYSVQHSTRVYALDKQGRLRAELYDASREATVGVAHALLAE
jgi:protein SCO1